VGNDFQNIAVTRQEEMPSDGKREIIDVSGFSQSQGRSSGWFQPMQDRAQPTPYAKEEKQAHRARIPAKMASTLLCSHGKTEMMMKS